MKVTIGGREVTTNFKGYLKITDFKWIAQYVDYEGSIVSISARTGYHVRNLPECIKKYFKRENIPLSDIRWSDPAKGPGGPAYVHPLVWMYVADRLGPVISEAVSARYHIAQYVDGYRASIRQFNQQPLATTTQRPKLEDVHQVPLVDDAIEDLRLAIQVQLSQAISPAQIMSDILHDAENLVLRGYTGVRLPFERTAIPELIQVAVKGFADGLPAKQVSEKMAEYFLHNINPLLDAHREVAGCLRPHTAAVLKLGQ